MYSWSYFQPQIAWPLSQLAVAWSAVGSKAMSAVHGRISQKTDEPLQSLKSKSQNDEKCLLDDHMQRLLQELGLHSLTNASDINSLNGLLFPVSHQVSSNVSAATFFQNRFGFAEESLQRVRFGGTSCGLPAFSTTQSETLRIGNSRQPHLQQVRWFKTRRREQPTGFGQTASPTDDLLTGMKFMKHSVFDKMSGTKPSDKFKSLVGEAELTPAVQDKLKIAFAEGYMAKDKKESPGSVSSWSRRLLKFAWYGLILWLVLQLLQTYTAIGGNMKISVLKGERFEVNPEEISVTFDDVKGMDEAKQELKDIVEFLRDHEKFKALGAKLPKGVLLVGPPGIGKSLLARAVAGESGVPFFHASGSEFDEIFVGTGAKRVRQLFDAAKMRAPCIVFIDEIDTVGAKRTSSQIHPYANQTINQLLSEMDGFHQNAGIIVLGATNRRDNLDKALLRPGRFDVEVQVFTPDLKGRKEIIDHYLNKVKFSDVDVDRLARGTTGCTGADLENMVNQAALKAAIDGDHTITMAHLEYARDKVLMGPAKKNKIPDDEANLLTAYHEAGHTLVAYYTKDSIPINKVTIIPRGPSLGHTSFVHDKEPYHITRSQLLASMDVAMGGRVAEEIVYGLDKVTVGASQDFQQATVIATNMVKKFGMSEKIGVRVFHDEDVDTGMSFLKLNEVGPATTEAVDNEIKRLLQESYERARVILKAHQTEHRTLAQALMKYETLDVQDVKDLLEGREPEYKKNIV